MPATVSRQNVRLSSAAVNSEERGRCPGVIRSRAYNFLLQAAL